MLCKKIRSSVDSGKITLDIDEILREISSSNISVEEIPEQIKQDNLEVAFRLGNAFLEYLKYAGAANNKIPLSVSMDSLINMCPQNERTKLTNQINELKESTSSLVVDDSETTRTLHIGSIDHSLSSDELVCLFDSILMELGLTKEELPVNYNLPVTKRSKNKGYGFARFKNVENINKAKSLLDKYNINIGKVDSDKVKNIKVENCLISSQMSKTLAPQRNLRLKPKNEDKEICFKITLTSKNFSVTDCEDIKNYFESLGFKDGQTMRIDFVKDYSNNKYTPYAFISFQHLNNDLSKLKALGRGETLNRNTFKIEELRKTIIDSYEISVARRYNSLPDIVTNLCTKKQEQNSSWIFSDVLFDTVQDGKGANHFRKNISSRNKFLVMIKTKSNNKWIGFYFKGSTPIKLLNHVDNSFKIDEISMVFVDNGVISEFHEKDNMPKFVKIPFGDQFFSINKENSNFKFEIKQFDSSILPSNLINLKYIFNIDSKNASDFLDKSFMMDRLIVIAFDKEKPGNSRFECLHRNPESSNSEVNIHKEDLTFKISKDEQTKKIKIYKMKNSSENEIEKDITVHRNPDFALGQSNQSIK